MLVTVSAALTVFHHILQSSEQEELSVPAELLSGAAVVT